MVALALTTDYDSTESDTERRQQINELGNVLNSKYSKANMNRL
jgi:hypothetical protein